MVRSSYIPPPINPRDLCKKAGGEGDKYPPEGDAERYTASKLFGAVGNEYSNGISSGVKYGVPGRGYDGVAVVPLIVTERKPGTRRLLL